MNLQLNQYYHSLLPEICQKSLELGKIFPSFRIVPKSKTSNPKKKKTKFANGYWVELPEGVQARKRDGYLWKVEVKLGEKRLRKFFRNGEAEQRDQFITEMEKASKLAEADRESLGNLELVEQASRASKELAAFGKTLPDAVDFYLSHLRAQESLDQTPLKSVIDDFLDAKERAGKSEVYLADLRQRLARFSKAFPDRSLSSFTPREIGDWLLGLPVGPQAKINQRRILHTLFAFAVKREMLASNPVTNIANDIEVRRKKTGILSPVEVARLLECADALTLPALALMVFCGVRREEVSRLDWSDIDFEDRELEISGLKAKRECHERQVAIPENAVEWLLPFAKQRGQIAPFPTRDSFNQALAKVRQKAGWEVGKWPKNALRQTFISCHYASFSDLGKTAEQAGTSAAIIHKHYRTLMKTKPALRLWEIRPASSEKIQPIAS